MKVWHRRGMAAARLIGFHWRGRHGCWPLAPLLALMSVLAAGCASTPPEAAAPGAVQASTAPPRAAQRAAQPFDEAVAGLADALVAKVDGTPRGRRILVIDPLIERATGAQTVATRSIGERIEQRVRSRHPGVELRPFNTAALAERPLILLGSMAGVAEAGSVQPAVGQPRVYRIWAVLADLESNRVLGREMAWVAAKDVDTRPTAFFRDSPAWMPDPVAAAYIRTCSSTAGTPVDPTYLQALQAQALLADAVAAYDAKRYQQALSGYDQALQLAGGEQLRALNGVYLVNWTLGRRGEAEQAFARLVDHGFRQDRLAMKLLFRPGSTAFWADPAVSGPYPMWLRQIARRAASRDSCLDVSGHTSPTGAAALNERLSLARARRVRTLLVRHEPVLAERTRARGLGPRENIVGTGTDDASDALDRRVEFRPLACA